MRSVLITALSLFATLAAVGQVSAAPSSDDALEARSPFPSPALEARAPEPSNKKRSPITKRSKQLTMTPSQQFSQQLCPFGMSVCPIASAAGVSTTAPSSLLGWITEGFECVDFEEDLTSCGGCGSMDVRRDCTAIPGAFGVSCIANACHIDSCKTGFSLSADGKACVN